MSILKKVKALYKRWFGRKRRKASSSARPVSNRKLLRKRVKPTRTSSVVGRASPTANQPYTPRGGNYDLSSGNTDDDVRSSRTNHESALEQLGRGAISTFGNDIQALLGDGKDVLKSLHGDFFSEKGYEAGAASRSVFKTFYDVGNADGTYSGLNRARDPEEDAFTHSLQQRTTEILDVLVSKDTLPPVQLESHMRRLNKEAGTLSSRGAFGTLDDPYIRRPGVGLIVDVIAQADREIVIDLYQLQNRTVLDALEQKVRDNPSIKLSVRLSLPDSKALGQTGFDILGPNLLSLERLRRVKESLGSRGDIELFVQDRKSHQKVTVTDKFGIIGSLNLTAPVGGDVNQAGSNYEVVRRLQTREYSEEQYRNQGMTPTPEQEILIGSSDKLYRQLQQSVGNRDALRGDPTSQLRLNQGQIVGAAETYEHLRSTLDLMKDSSNKQFYGILNQVFLLYHEDTMFNEMLQGEMGKFDTPSTVRGPVYKGIQTELLDLVIENRAFLAVDNRNYSEHVLTPMYERTKEIFEGTNLPLNSLEDLVGRVGFDRSNPITSFMARVDEAMGGEALAKGFTESYARQLLAITSGNIRLTTVPMQHSKQYLVIEGGGTTPPGDGKAFQSGSSNIGPNSVHAPEWGMDPKEVERTNREFGLALLFGKTSNGPNALTLEEVTAELALAKESFSKDWSTLTRTALGSVDGRPTSPWYEDKVDKVRLSELHARLTELTTSLGVGEVSYRYGGKSGTERTGLSLTMDARKLAGFGEGFERILGKGPTFRWDYTTLSGAMGADEGYVLDITSGRLISRSLIHNSSASNLNIRMEDISKGIGQDVLLGRAEVVGKPFVSVAPNKAAVMNPIGTALSLVSTLLLESTNRLLVWGPEQYLAGLGDGEKRTLVERYLDSFTPGRTLMEAAGEGDRSNITTLMDTLERRLTGDVDGALEKVRTWFPGETRDMKALQAVVGSIKPLLSSMAYGYSMEEHIALNLEGKTLEEARAIVSDNDMVRKRVQRAGDYIRGTGGLVDTLVPLLDSNPEFRLAVVQATVAQTNPSYTEILSSGISALSGALTEPYLLAAQAWQYSGSQAWYRMPMYGVTEQSQELVDGLKGTWAEALASQAFTIPREISPFSSLGISGLLRGVAGGSNNEGTDVDTGLTLFGQKGTPVATIMHHAIASSMGVGFSTTRDDILASGLSDSAKNRALAVFNEAGGDELLAYLFGGVGKVAQIPQRLKNAQGQRGMGTLSKAFREAVGGARGAPPRPGRGDFLAVARAYRKSLEERLKERLVRANPQWTPNQVQAQVDRLIPEQDTVLATAFAMSVRGVMGGEQAAIMEAYERALMELGLNEEDFLEDGLGQELVRVRAISSDVMSTGMKGFTASSTYALVQMAGMYSDYFYANPLHSQMEGSLRTTTKKVKASMLGVDWTRADGGGMELARAQDIVMFDTTLQKVIVVNHINGTTKNYGLADLTTNDLNTLKETLDDRGQRSVLEGMIENKGREAGRSSVSTITTTGWVRPGEDSKEYLLSMKALPGGGRNQLFYDLTYVQAKTPNGGSRVDSGTSLFKGVAVFLTASYFEGIAKSRKHDSILGSISAQDTFGLINPSNLKSFSLEHGGSLLRGGKAEQVLASLSEREAAVAMLLAFGSNYIDAPDKGALSTALYEAMRTMPGVYGETALQIGLREGQELGASSLLKSLDKLWNPASMFSLMDITGDAMLSSLSGGTGIKSVLSDLLSKGTKSSQYLNVDDAGERQAATILTALDITRQLLRDERVTPGDVSMRSDAVEQLMSIVGLSEAPPEAITHAMISGLTSNVPSVYMKMGLSYSSTKEPIGTKGTGALQNADLVRPFTQIAKEFSTGGDMSKMRVVLANMLVSTAITQTASSVIKHLLPGAALPIRSVLDPQLFTPLAMSQNLGIYGSGMEDITALKKLYKDYGQSVQAAINERLTGIASSTGDIHVLGSELSTLLFDSADPSSNQAVRDILGTRWRPEYETSLSSIQDVGRRYELLASKPFAVGEAEAIASQMGHERGIFYLPAIVFDPMPSESGRVVARIDDYSQGTSFFIPGAEDLRTYGIQYGSYTDGLVRSTLTLASAFSPGTVIGNIFSTLSKVRASGSGYVEFTPQEVKAIQEYYVTAYSITERIAEASAGTRLKLEMRTRGFVGTFAASFGIPQGMFLAPEEGMRGSGDVRDSQRRRRLEEVTSAISGTDVSKSAMRLLTAERDALMGGMGEKGTNLLQVINEDLEYLRRYASVDLSKNPSLQKEYAAARLWTTQDAQHVSTLMEKVNSIGTGTVEAVRLLQEVKDYTRKRTGSETVPTNIGVRSYMDIVGPRQGNEGNYYAVELGTQLMRSSLGLNSNRSRSRESTLRGMNDQYSISGPRVERSSTLDFIQPYLISNDLPLVGALRLDLPSVEGLPALGKLSRAVKQVALFTGNYESEYLTNNYEYMDVKKGTLTRVRELEESIARGPKHLEYQRRSLDRNYQNAKYALTRAENDYEYTRDKLYGYNREGMGLNERVVHLERTLASGKTPYDYRERQLQQEVRTWEWELRNIGREEDKLQAQVRGVSQAMQGKEVEVDREWAHWYEDASLESPYRHVEGVNEALTRQFTSLKEVEGRLTRATKKLDIYSSLSGEQLRGAEEVWTPWRVQEALRNTDPTYMDRYRASLSYLDIAINSTEGRDKSSLIATKNNIQGEVRLGSDKSGYAWFSPNDTIDTLEASRKKLEVMSDRIRDSISRSEAKVERLMGYLPSNEELAILSRNRKVAEGNLLTARTTLQDPSLQNQKDEWRREREEQLAQARVSKSEAEAKLSSLGTELITLRANKDSAYTSYVQGLEKYETDKKAWVTQKQGKLDRLKEIVRKQRADLSEDGPLIRKFSTTEQSALDSNLRGQLSNAITAHKAGQYQGAVTGRIETYRIDRSLFQGLGMNEGRELLSGSVLQAKGSVDQLLKHLSDVDTAYGYGPQEIALIGTSRSELETLSSELDTLHKSRNDWTSIEAPLARMETLQVSLSTSDVLQATVFRSAPFGSGEIQRQQLSAVGTVGDLNQYLAGQGMTQLDEARNKTLGLISSLSAITMNLGDVDGDPYTVIFSKIGSAMNDRQRLEDRVRANTIRMGMVRREAAASGSEYIDDYIATIDEYKAANTAIASRISRIDSEMGVLRDGLVETYDPLLRKEVASYMGISQSFLTEYQDSPITMEVLPTYLQQGRGLFGGIEGVAHKNSLVAMHATMEQIYATEDFKGTLKAIRDGTSLTEALSPYAADASSILQEVSDNRFKELLTENPNLREDFLTRMVESIQASPTREVSESLMYGAAQLTTSEGAISSYSKYMGMSSGASMAPTVYDMLTKTLGVAGGDILGKSYNALVGTLFRDSPLIALSHVLSSNTAMEGMRDYYRGTGIDDADVDGQIAEVHAEAKRAESLQGFMKSAQQLLRDSIKFKGDTNVLGELQRGHAEYEKHLALGDEDSARAVLNEMAGKLGPSTGSGLRSYMQLNTLVESSNRSLYTSSLSSVTSDDMSYLNREYKIDSNEGIDKLTREMRDRGYDGDPLVGDVVRYKVARDMRATITAFRYELGSKDNQPFLETVWRGMRGFLGTTDRERGMEDRFRADPSLAHDIGAALSADANSWWGEASSKNKALMLALVDEGRKQTDPIFGETGEGLKDFVTLEVLRKKATAVASGRADGISGIPEGVMNADVTITMMNAAMGDKLSPEATASFMGVMMDYLGSGSKMDDILSQTKGGQAFLELSRDAAGESMRVVDRADGSTRFVYHDEELLPGEKYREFTVGGQKYQSPLDWLDSAVAATATGNKAMMLEATAKAITGQLRAGAGATWDGTIQNALGASISENEIRSATISRLQELKVKEGIVPQEASRQAMEESKDPIHMDETRRLRGIEMREAASPLISQALRSQATVIIPRASLTGMVLGASQVNHMRRSQEMHNAVGRMHDMNDMVLGAGLTLLGSLMATGSINENTIGQVVGGTVSMLGYSQMGRPGVHSVLGQAFRARMAHAESKGSSDEGEWVRRWVGREVGFYMGAAVLAPAIMGGAERLLSKFSPLRLDRPMDMDKYKNWKAAANTIGGAVLSSVLGMVTAAVGGHVAVHGTSLIPSLGVVENFVRNMADTESKRQDMIAERLAQVGEGTVMDGEGDPLRASIEVSYIMDNPTTDFSAYPMGESDYSAGDNWEVNVVG